MNQQIVNMLQSLAVKLGTTVQYLWQVEIKQAYVTGIIDLIWCVLLACAIIAIYKFMRWCLDGVRRVNDRYHIDDAGYIVGCVFSVIGIVVCGIFIGVDLTSAISHLLNPANFAFWNITSAL